MKIINTYRFQDTKKRVGYGQSPAQAMIAVLGEGQYHTMPKLRVPEFIPTRKLNSDAFGAAVVEDHSGHIVGSLWKGAFPETDSLVS